jgi:CheY-like chemotaxis protein
VVVEMNDMLQRLIGEDIELRHKLDPDLEAVKVDVGQIQQVIMNLIVNAGDAITADDTCRGGTCRGGQITVTTRNIELDESHAERDSVLVAGRYVMLSVRDTGCGMDDATRSQIFDPFFTTKEQGKGTGLGLSTVYGIVRQSGGGISVESRPGEGATFKVYLLRADEKITAELPKSSQERATRGSETILLVEDDEMFRELLAEVLEACGYTVLAAAEPAAALEIRERHNGEIHLLVSDMVMPGMSGSELARQLVDIQADIRVLLMSGYTDEALKDRGVLETGGAFLQKPFSTKDFTRTVRRLLDGEEDKK